MYGKTELRPPPPARPFAPDHRVSRLKIIALATFFVLVIAALGVVVILPSQVNNAPDAVATSPSPRPAERAPAVGQATPAASQPSSLEIVAHKLLKEALRLQAGLESDGVKIWGAPKLTPTTPGAPTRT